MPLPLKKECHIVGSGITWDLAHYNRDDVDIWGLSTMIPKMPRVDRLFEMHSTGDAERFKGLQAAECPVYMQKEWEQIPNSIEYPLDKIVDKFGHHFASSISYMLALAIDEGYKKISIYGVSMSHNTEYRTQRHSVEYLIGYAKGLGIEITIPKEEDLGKSIFLYGYEKPSLLEKAEVKFQKMINALEKLEYEKQKLDAKINQLKGAIENCELFINYFY